MTTAIDNSAPRVSLLDKDLASMTEDELRAFVLEVRAKRNSQQLAYENKPTRKPRSTSTTETASKRQKLMADLLSDDED